MNCVICYTVYNTDININKCVVDVGTGLQHWKTIVRPHE